MVILDTNIVINHLRQSPGTSELSHLLQRIPIPDIRLSMITIQELYEGKSTREEGKEKDMIALISQFQILAYTYEVAQLAGQLSRDAKGPLEFTDSAIAATAITHGALLYTLNTRHFAPVPGLEFYNAS